MLDLSCDLEQMKQLLVKKDSKFFLVPSKNLLATYKVLWYRSPYGKCKVDVLKPGVMNIPNMDSDEITYSSSDHLPMMPLLVVFLLKLQGWEDHKNAYREYLKEKAEIDAKDINYLLPLVAKSEEKLQSMPWIPRGFISRAESRVKRYVLEYEDSREYWSIIGFDV